VKADEPRRKSRILGDERVPADPAGSGLEALLDVTMPLIVEIGRSTMMVQDIINLGVGSVIQLDRAVGEPVDVFVSDRRLAEGEIVIVGDRFGIKITRVVRGERLQRSAPAFNDGELESGPDDDESAVEAA
jgi:flagellar motor switch protein FliN